MPRTLPLISSNDLDWLAEAANGMQGKPLTVYLDPEGKHVGIAETSRGVPAGAEPLFEVQDPGTKMLPPDRVTLTYTTDRRDGARKQETHELLAEHPDSDALFWTASAIEKFVLPYYVAQRLLTGEELQAIVNDYKEGNISAILHVQPSKPYRYPGNSPYVVYPREGVGAVGGPIDLLAYVSALLNQKKEVLAQPGA